MQDACIIGFEEELLVLSMIMKIYDYSIFAFMTL